MWRGLHLGFSLVTAVAQIHRADVIHPASPWRVFVLRYPNTFHL